MRAREVRGLDKDPFPHLLRGRVGERKRTVKGHLGGPQVHPVKGDGPSRDPDPDAGQGSDVSRHVSATPTFPSPEDGSVQRRRRTRRCADLESRVMYLFGTLSR